MLAAFRSLSTSKLNLSSIGISIGRSLGLLTGAFITCSSHSLAADFDGNGSDDVLLWDRDSGVYSAVNINGGVISKQCGLPGDRPLWGDVDGDGRDEAIVFRVSPSATSGGIFHACRVDGTVISQTLGQAGDRGVSNVDFDGDAKADFSVFRPSSGEWLIVLSSGGTVQQRNWGEHGDLPVAGDYDGDGRGDLAVFRPISAEFKILNSADGRVSSIQLGQIGDLPVVADYDGDGRDDAAVFSPASGMWMVSASSDDGAILTAQFGQSEDLPVPADLNGDGRADLALYRPFAGAILWAANPDALNPATGPVRSTRVTGVFTRRVVAGSGEVRANAFADFDGDGRSDYAVARLNQNQVTWFVADTAGRPIHQQEWGIGSDRLVPGDFDGDGQFDFAVARGSAGAGINWFFLSSRNRVGWGSAFGLGGDTVRAADFDGDGKTDPVVVRADSLGSLQWFVLRSSVRTPLQRAWGLAGDSVVTGDFTGDGRSEFTVVRDQQGLLYWYVLSNEGQLQAVVQWGLSGDSIVPGDYDGDGRDDFAVTRAVAGLLYTFVRTQNNQLIQLAQWGLAGDEVVSAHYTGSRAVQLAVWRSGPFAPTYFVDRSPSVLQRTSQFLTQLQWGFPKDFVLARQKVGGQIATEPVVTPPPAAPPVATPQNPSSTPGSSTNRLAQACPTIRELGYPELYKRGSSSHIPGADARSGKPSYIGKIRAASNPSYACVDILDSHGNKISAFGRYAGAGTNYQFRYYVGHNAGGCGGGHTASTIDSRARRNTGSSTIYLKKSANLCLRVRGGALTARQGSVR